MERLASKPSRVNSIDFWRGFILVSIFINHVPGNMFEAFTHKNIGFSDATEAFVFLSGLSVALAYGRRFMTGEMNLPIKAIHRRIFTIYSVQILLSLTAIFLFLAAAILFDDDGLLAEHGRDIVLDKPLRAILAIAGLSHQIGYFNILPLYVVLLLATPAILALAKRNISLMLVVSVCVYALARIFEVNLPTWPVEGQWFFNPFTWQLLYCIGLYVGLNLHRIANIRSPLLFIMSLLMVVVSMLIVRNFFGLLPDLNETARELFDLSKTDLGIARLIHFLALAYVVYYTGLARMLSRIPFYSPLCLIGRHSLPVFATGSLLSAIGQIVQYKISLTIPDEVLLIGTGIALHYLVAKSFAIMKQRRRVPALVGN